MTRETFALLEKYMLSCAGDAAHDSEHVRRVLYLALEIAETEEGVDRDLLIAAPVRGPACRLFANCDTTADDLYQPCPVCGPSGRRRAWAKVGNSLCTGLYCTRRVRRAGLSGIPGRAGLPVRENRRLCARLCFRCMDYRVLLKTYWGFDTAPVHRYDTWHGSLLYIRYHLVYGADRDGAVAEPDLLRVSVPGRRCGENWPCCCRYKGPCETAGGGVNPIILARIRWPVPELAGGRISGRRPSQQMLPVRRHLLAVFFVQNTRNA